MKELEKEMLVLSDLGADCERMDEEFMTDLENEQEELIDNIRSVDKSMRDHFIHQKNETIRLSKEVVELKGEKTALQKVLVECQSKVTQFETMVGNDPL